MTTLRKIFPSFDFHLEELPYETLSRLEVTMDDFMDALKDVEPSAMREVFVEPRTSGGLTGGLENINKP